MLSLAESVTGPSVTHWLMGTVTKIRFVGNPSSSGEFITHTHTEHGNTSATNDMSLTAMECLSTCIPDGFSSLCLRLQLPQLCQAALQRGCSSLHTSYTASSSLVSGNHYLDAATVQPFCCVLSAYKQDRLLAVSLVSFFKRTSV